MTLYHVSLIPVTCFYPRIPGNRASGEDSKIKRICCSNSIKNCINAMPGGASTIDCLFRISVNPVIFVYKMEVPEHAEYMLEPNQVFPYVPDAIGNSEYWLTETPVDIQELVYHVREMEIESGHDPYGMPVYHVGRICLDPISDRETFKDNIRQILEQAGPDNQEALAKLIEKYGLSTCLRNVYSQWRLEETLQKLRELKKTKED